ncbi:hypothetical protein E2C01_033541 [Portunus trituberculatus]|uniref:Uncharacterized protein n=1 Tax=Portunus trituberculatus TaxID=210409 RepID=A0A5B7F4C9_PORTR|nr:hypothetical protein [Portunus trituberculatus]
MYASHVARPKRKETRSSVPRRYKVTIGASRKCHRHIPIKMYFNYWLWYGTRAFTLSSVTEKVCASLFFP